MIEKTDNFTVSEKLITYWAVQVGIAKIGESIDTPEKIITGYDYQGNPFVVDKETYLYNCVTDIDWMERNTNQKEALVEWSKIIDSLNEVKTDVLKNLVFNIYAGKLKLRDLMED